MGGEGEQVFPAVTGHNEQISETRTEHWSEDAATVEVLITASPPMRAPFRASYLVKVVPGLVGVSLECAGDS